MRVTRQTHSRTFCCLFCCFLTSLLILSITPAIAQDSPARVDPKALSPDKQAKKESDKKKSGQTTKEATGGEAASPKAAPDDKSDGKPEDKSPPALNPGRPTITDPAALTAPGWLETELGIQQDLNRDRIFGTPLLFKLTDRNHRLQYRLASDGYLRLGDRTDGIGDTYAALHYLLTPMTKSGFDVAARFTLKFPTARRPLGGTQKFDPGLLLIASRDFTKWGLHGDFNFGLSSLSRTALRGTDTSMLLTASLTVPIRGGRWAYTNELVYTSPILGQRASVTTMHGFTYAVHRYEVYDVALQWGLHGDGASFQILFGRTFFLGKLF